MEIHHRRQYKICKSECRTVERDEADGKRGKRLHDSIALRPFPAAFAA